MKNITIVSKSTHRTKVSHLKLFFFVNFDSFVFNKVISDIWSYGMPPNCERKLMLLALYRHWRHRISNDRSFSKYRYTSVESTSSTGTRTSVIRKQTVYKHCLECDSKFINLNNDYGVFNKLVFNVWNVLFVYAFKFEHLHRNLQW